MGLVSHLFFLRQEWPIYECNFLHTATESKAMVMMVISTVILLFDISSYSEKEIRKLNRRESEWSAGKRSEKGKLKCLFGPMWA